MDNNGATVPTTNGHATEDHLADLLQEDATVGYQPQMPLEALWLAGADMPQVTLRRDIEVMQLHPVVIAAMEYYRSGIAGAEFWGGPDQANPDNDKGKPISPDPRVSQFVLAHVEKFWGCGVPILQEGYPYGWTPGEHVYKEYEGMLVWSHLKGFHPNDGFVLTLRHAPVGIRVKNIRERAPVDLWFAEGCVPAKACWYAHRPKFNQFYGRSQLLGAWRPWRRLAWRDGLEQVEDAAGYRAGYCGPIVRYPPGHGAPTAREGIPATQVDGQGGRRRENRDVARQMCEWAKAGASFALSSENYPQAAGGGPKWDVQWPEHVMDVSPLLKAGEHLEDQIMLGVGVPPELIKAGGTGSGYSGRSIPREAFLDQQQRIADAMLQMFVEQVIRPLVLWNFGNIPFAIQCKPLLKTQSENKQGEPKPPLPQPGAEGAQQPPGGAPPGAPTPPTTPPPQSGHAMSLESRTMSIIERVRRRLVA